MKPGELAPALADVLAWAVACPRVKCGRLVGEPCKVVRGRTTKNLMRPHPERAEVWVQSPMFGALQDVTVARALGGTDGDLLLPGLLDLRRPELVRVAATCIALVERGAS